jgi:TRAP-type C4-dicarboxylate transport system permease large subunit
MLAIVVLLGCFIEQVSIMMITLPIFMPIVEGSGMDPMGLYFDSSLSIHWTTESALGLALCHEGDQSSGN